MMNLDEKVDEVVADLKVPYSVHVGEHIESDDYDIDRLAYRLRLLGYKVVVEEPIDRFYASLGRYEESRLFTVTKKREVYFNNKKE